MDSGRGELISRAFRIRNLMEEKVAYGPNHLTVEEARVLELIRLERPGDPDTDSRLARIEEKLNWIPGRR